MAENKNPHDNQMIFFLCVFAFALLCTVVWLGMSTQISDGVRWIRVGQLEVISLFTDRYDSLLHILKRMRSQDIKPAHILIMTEAATSMLKLPFAVILAGMSVVCFFYKSSHPFVRKLDLEGVAKEQARAFPVTMPITKFNPLKAGHRMIGAPVPDKLPVFAEALTPEEWVSFHAIPLIEGVVDREAARRAFAKQLGGRWKGSSALPWYGRALFAAFSMKASGMRIESDEFLGRLASCWQPGKGLVLSSDLRKEIMQRINDPKIGRITEKVAAQHAFVAPSLLRCLYIAREQGGVLAPAQFLWLRAVDRNLWYPLNNLGRGSVHIEAAGAIAHYRTEKIANKAIPNPQVDIAVDGLIQYIETNEIRNFPAKEFSRA